MPKIAQFSYFYFFRPISYFFYFALLNNFYISYLCFSLNVPIVLVAVVLAHTKSSLFSTSAYSPSSVLSV